MTTQYSPTRDQNTEWFFQVLMRDKDTQAPIDLTGYTFGFQIRNGGTNAILLDVAAEGGVTCDDPTSGTFDCLVTSAQLYELPTGQLPFGVVAIQPDTERVAVVSGSLNVQKVRVS